MDIMSPKKNLKFLPLYLIAGFIMGINFLYVICYNPHPYKRVEIQEPENDFSGLSESSLELWNKYTYGVAQAVAISGDGNFIVVGTSHGRIYFFNRTNSEPLWTYNVRNGEDIYSVAISWDGEEIVVGSYDDDVYLFNSTPSGDKKPMWNYTTGTNVNSVDISGNGDYIVAGSGSVVYLFDKSGYLWEYTTGGAVTTVSISFNSNYFVAGSLDNRVYLFNRATESKIWDDGTGGDVSSVAMSDSGYYFVVGSASDDVIYYNRTSTTPEWTYSTGDDVQSVDISASGNYIVAGSWDNKLYYFESDSSTPDWSYTANGVVYSVAITNDGEYILAGDWNIGEGSVYLFEQASGNPIWNDTLDGNVYSVDISDDSYPFLVSGDDDFYVHVIEPFPIQAPTLVSPSNGFTTNDDTPLLDWNSATDAINYQLQVDTELSFTAPFTTNITTTNTEYTSATLSDNTYFWKVRAQFPLGNWGYWSEVRSFTVDTIAPSAPSLVSPLNDSQINDNTPLLDWNVAPGSSEYHVQVDTDTGFTAPFIINDTTSNTYYTAATLSDDTYYWRVRARDSAGNWGDWSENWSFTIDTNAPSAPSLIALLNNTLTNDNTPAMNWSDVSDAFQYQFQVATTINFILPLTVNITTPNSEYTPITLPDGFYYWRVRTQDAAKNWGSWSEVWTFIIDTIGPSIPDLLNPSAGEQFENETISFTWNSVLDAVLYHLQIDDDNDFSSPEKEVWLIVISKEYSNFSDGDYYWRVRAQDEAGNWGSWSVAQNFEIETGGSGDNKGDNGDENGGLNIMSILVGIFGSVVSAGLAVIGFQRKKHRLGRLLNKFKEDYDEIQKISPSIKEKRQELNNLDYLQASSLKKEIKPLNKKEDSLQESLKKKATKILKKFEEIKNNDKFLKKYHDSVRIQIYKLWGQYTSEKISQVEFFLALEPLILKKKGEIYAESITKLEHLPTKDSFKNGDNQNLS